MKHIFIEGSKSDKTVVLLHGTGGDEKSLLPIAEYLDTGYNILSIRGTVNENGALRYFKRKAKGVYDIENLEENAAELVEFIKKSSETHDFDLSEVVFIGFSNGANIATHILLHPNYPFFNKGILMAPLYSLKINTNQDLSDIKLFVSIGRQDPICSMDENEKLLKLLDEMEIEVTIEWVKGHEITENILKKGKDWFDQL